MYFLHAVMYTRKEDKFMQTVDFYFSVYFNFFYDAGLVEHPVCYACLHSSTHTYVI